MRTLCGQYNGACPAFLFDPFPSLEITYIETLLVPTQYVAVLFALYAAWHSLTAGFSNYNRLGQWQTALHKLRASSPSASEFDIVGCGLAASRNKAIWDIVIGVAELFTAYGFFVLGSFTLKLDKLVSVKNLIDSLILLNIALLPFLADMWCAYTDVAKNSARKDNLALLLDQYDFSDPETAPQVLLMACYDAGYTEGTLHEAIQSIDPAYLPIYNATGTGTGGNENENGADLLELEIEALEVLISELSTVDSYSADIAEQMREGDEGFKGGARGRVAVASPAKAMRSSSSKNKNKSNSNSKSRSKSKNKRGQDEEEEEDEDEEKDVDFPLPSNARVARSNAAYSLRLQSRQLKDTAALKLVYFFLNCVAGYGYSMGVLEFYFPSGAAGLYLYLYSGCILT